MLPFILLYYTTLLQAFPWAIVLFHPRGTAAFLGAAVGKQFDDVIREGGGVTGGKDAVNQPLHVRWRKVAEHRHVVDLLELKPEGGEVDVAAAVQQGLRLLVRHAGRLLGGKARDAQIRGGLRLVRAESFGVAAPWSSFTQRRRTCSVVRVAT